MREIAISDPQFPGHSPEIVRAAERLVIGSEWVAAERVIVRRRIVTETITVSVDVRREELVFEQAPIEALPVRAEPPIGSDPLVVTLHEEVPEIVLVTRPYERVTLDVVRVASEQEIATDLDREEIELS